MKIALLGSSGWIAHYLALSLHQRLPGIQTIGTYRNRKPDTDFPVICLSNSQRDQIASLLEREEVTSIVNLTRGESETDFLLHRRLIDFSNAHGANYFYLSSFNACDAQLTSPHYESELPSAQSEYGEFKARCELALLENARHFAIFRFSATHGWAPNRCARTETFLKQLAAGEKIAATRGVLQNRTAVTDLADMMAAIIATQGKGVFHLGAMDANEEIDFLKGMAREFGHDESMIISGDTAPANANMVPGKIYRLFGNEFHRTESEAIKAVGRMPELQIHRRSKLPNEVNLHVA